MSRAAMLASAAAVAVLGALALAAAWVWRDLMRIVRDARAHQALLTSQEAAASQRARDFLLLPRGQAEAVPPRLERRTSCFACEAQAAREGGEGSAWRGQPSRCFACQEEKARTKGEAAGFEGLVTATE